MDAAAEGARLIDIDGSYGEGGGQLLRMAVALSAVTGQAVLVTDIRANRPNPGLAAQHVTAVKAVQSLCGARAEGLSAGSSTLTFAPGPLRGGSVALDVGTAGSVCLVLQACLLPALRAPGAVDLDLTGGTDVRWSPPADYFSHVFGAAIERMGARFSMQVVRRGYYPRGGGRVVARVDPSPRLQPLVPSETGETKRMGGRAHVGNLPDTIAERMRAAAAKELSRWGDPNIEAVAFHREEAQGEGGACVVWAETSAGVVGGDALAEKGVQAEEVGRRAAAGLRNALHSGATVDEHLSDMLLPYMVLADGASTYTVTKVTPHAETCMWLLTQLTGTEFDVENQGGLWRVAVRR